jgi:transposase
MSPIVKRTWAPAGKTPKISHKTRSHKKISAIGAVTVRHTGKRSRLMFRLLEGKNANSQVFIQFLNQLLQNIRGHVIVVWDRLVAHRSKAVTGWLKKHRRIETEFFPPYAPELNPVEYLWSHLKMNGLANFAALDLAQLYAEAKGALCDIRKNTNLLDAFIAHSPANFFGS